MLGVVLPVEWRLELWLRWKIGWFDWWLVGKLRVECETRWTVGWVLVKEFISISNGKSWLLYEFYTAFKLSLPPTDSPPTTESLMTQISNCTSTSKLLQTAISSLVLPPSTAPYYECLIVQLSNCRLLLTPSATSTIQEYLFEQLSNCHLAFCWRLLHCPSFIWMFVWAAFKLPPRLLRQRLSLVAPPSIYAFYLLSYFYSTSTVPTLLPTLPFLCTEAAQWL